MSIVPPSPSPAAGLTPPDASSTAPAEREEGEDREEIEEAEEERKIVRSELLAKTEDDRWFEKEESRCGQIVNALGLLCEAAEKARATTGTERRLAKRGGGGG